MVNRAILALYLCRVYIIEQKTRNVSCPALLPYGIMRWTGFDPGHMIISYRVGLQQDRR